MKTSESLRILFSVLIENFPSWKSVWIWATEEWLRQSRNGAKVQFEEASRELGFPEKCQKLFKWAISQKFYLANKSFLCWDGPRRSENFLVRFWKHLKLFVDVSESLFDVVKPLILCYHRASEDPILTNINNGRFCPVDSENILVKSLRKILQEKLPKFHRFPSNVLLL